MRDLTRKGYSTNSPERSYYNLSERIEAIESKFNRMEQGLIDAIVRLNSL